eukprot:scaffold62950_cov39-Prasinocladus_malaysianus.AAC.1
MADPRAAAGSSGGPATPPGSQDSMSSRPATQARSDMEPSGVLHLLNLNRAFWHPHGRKKPDWGFFCIDPDDANASDDIIEKAKTEIAEVAKAMKPRKYVMEYKNQIMTLTAHVTKYHGQLLKSLQGEPLAPAATTTAAAGVKRSEIDACLRLPPTGNTITDHLSASGQQSAAACKKPRKNTNTIRQR